VLDVSPVRGRRLRAALALTAAAALVGGCTADVENGHGSTLGSASPSPTRSGNSSPSGADRQPAANFGACGNGVDIGSASVPSHFTMRCAKISVPLDYAEPDGKQITVALVRLHDRSDSSPIGSLLMDPGGPGGSGVQFAASIAAALPSTVTSHFDIVGFDPRGVGSSTPIECETDKQKDAATAASPDVRTDAGFVQAKQQAAQLARACTSKYGADLAQFDTVQTAKDMDRIRQALGDEHMNYLGFSYGTELGAQYARLFPSKIRVAVLDGAVDPLTDDITSFANQLDGFEKAFDQFADWCPDHNPCSSLDDPRQTVYDLVDQARTDPIPASGETRVATPSIVDLAVLSGLYSQSFWPILTQALLTARDGDSRVLFQLADNYNERENGHYSNILEANTTIGCNDSEPGPSDSTIRATTAQWVKRFPMFGLWSAGSLFACQQWQGKRTPPPLPVARTTAHKLLVVGNLHDPATPYQGAKDLTKTLGNAVLLSWDGEGHTSYLQGSSCIDGYVNAYLLSGTLPPTGTTCPR
jgi:pimeloyl-ACP methyl ester carboxylesterase